MRANSGSHRQIVGGIGVIAVIAGVAGCSRGGGLGYLAPAGGDDGRTGFGLVHASVSAALRDEYRGQAKRTPPPVALVPSDGSELELRALAATVKIEGPLAHTELRLTFRNRERRVREGRFSIALPPDAAVGRFAMKIGESWREARIVTRERGREVYERFLHRGVDPALLEQDLGSQFSARVFPIAPEADKELVLAYDHQVSAVRPYTLALEGLPAIPALSIALDHDGATRAVERNGVAPEDLVIPIAGGSDAVAGEGAFVARISADELERGGSPTHAAAPGAASPAALERVLVLVDTSASRATVMGRQVELVRALAAALPPDATVAIAAFDHAVSEVYRGRAADAGAAVGALYEHGALGASDLGGALRRAAAAGLERVVIVGDGAPTLGERDQARLAAIVAGSAIARIDAVQIGQSLEREKLAAIVAAGRDPGAILDGRDAARVAHQLVVALPREEPIRVNGVTASFPATTRGVAPGEPIWVAGQRPAGAGPLVVRIGARTVEVSPRRAEPVRVRRAAAKAELAALTERMQRAADPAERDALGARIEALALANGLVSARTSLLVLESDADERRMLTAEERGEAPRPGAPVAAPAPGPASPAVPVSPRVAGAAAAPQHDSTGGEPIVVTGLAPIIDQGSTRTGITITTDYSRHIPVERTFGSVLGEAGGEGGEMITISGSSSLENRYHVDGINGGTYVGWSEPGLSPLALDVLADRMRSSAAPFGVPSRYVAPDPEPASIAPYAGEYRAVMSALAGRDRDGALARAIRWQLGSPGDVAALLALGESLEARGAGALAARAYASLLDLYPNRAELLRAAGERLDRVAATAPAARALAIDAYRRALRERPDHVSTYRLLAYALFRDGRGDEAVDVLGAALARAPRASVTEILASDAGVIAAALVARDPRKRKALAPRMLRGIADRPSLRVVLSWETDANDVDLHVRDRAGGHAYYSQRQLASGGALLDDLTDGYGPEMFAVDTPAAFPYRAAVHYYNRGPMGVGLGTVQVIHHDGAGGVTIEDRPFAIQNDGAMIELGEIRGPGAGAIAARARR
jgi:tetratricopeptide (TPR) repeat protein